MTQKTWSLGIKLFNDITESILLSQSLKNSSSDAERVLSIIGKIFSRHLNNELNQKLSPVTVVHTNKISSLDDLTVELEFIQDTEQRSLAFEGRNETLSDFFEAVLVEAAKVVEDIHRMNPDYPEQVTVSAKPLQNGIQTKSVLCAELVNKLRRTNIKMEPVTFVLPSGKTLDMHLKRIQNHSLQTSEKTITLTGRIVDFSDLDQVLKLQENGMRLIHKILIPSLRMETRDVLLDCFKAHDLVTVTVTPRNKLISGTEEPSDYEFINYSLSQQKIA